MSTRTFSRKTVAIALASATALGGVNVVAPTATVLSTPVAHAAEADPNAKPGIKAEDVKFTGIFNADGKKINGPYNSGRKGDPGETMRYDSGATMKATVDLSNVKGGEKVTITPKNALTLPNGEKVAPQSHSGLRIPSQSTWKNINTDSGIVGKYRYVKSGGIEIEFNNNVNDVKTGTITVEAPAMIWNQYITAKQNGVDDWDGKRIVNQGTTQPFIEVKAGSNTAEQKLNTTAHLEYITSANTRDDLRYYDNTPAVVNTEEKTVTLSASTIDLPAGANGTATLTPMTQGERSADWVLAPNLKLTPKIDVYGERGEDGEYTRTGMTLDEAKAKWPNLKVEATQTNDGITVNTAGVPDNVAVQISVRRGEGESGIAYGTYLENGGMYGDLTFTGTLPGDEGEVTQKGFNNVNILTRIPGAASIEGLTNVNWSAALDGAIADQPAGAGKGDNIAHIGGTTQTFQFFVKNTGDAYLAAPLVTLPNGKRVPVKGVGINPDEEGSFSVDYAVPAGTGVANFTVSMGKADFQPTNKISFRYDDAADADNNNIKYPTDDGKKKAPRGQTTTVTPTGVPKGAKPARTEGTPDWAEIGPDGTLTLKPNNSAPLGRTEIPVKFTFPDGTETTVTPAVTVAEFDPNAKGDGTFDPRTEDEKANDEIIDGINDLGEKAKKQNEELKRQTDELKKQADALNKQSATLKHMQDELGKANKLNEEQNKLIGEQTDAINKQTGAIDKQTAAVEKQTAEISKRLDDSNKIAQDQLETMNKELAESIKQTREMVRQSKALEHQNQILIDQHADQLAQWEKENGFAQNEQDDRRHKANFERCMTSDPATGILVALPILAMAASVGVPYFGHLLESADSQLAALNNRLGTQANIPPQLRNQINDFNANYGDMTRTAGAAVAGLSALAGLAVAINNLTNGCYAEADVSVGREPKAPKKLNESVLSSKPWIQDDAKAENAEAGAENSSEVEGDSEAAAENAEAEDVAAEGTAAENTEAENTEAEAETPAE